MLTEEQVGVMQAACDAIEARLQLLMQWRASDSGAASSYMAIRFRDDKAAARGMISAALAVSLVARPALPLQADPVARYKAYCTALAQLSALFHVAIEGGALALRSLPSRAPVRISGSLDLVQQKSAGYGFTGLSLSVAKRIKALPPHSDQWPDEGLMPRGFVDINEFRAWAEGQGIAWPALDGGTPTIATDLVEPSTPWSDGWTPERCFHRLTEITRELGTTYGASKRLQRECGLSDRELRRRISQARGTKAKVPVTPINVMADVLSGKKSRR